MARRKPGGITVAERRILEALKEAPAHPYSLVASLDIPERTISGALNRLQELGMTNSKAEIVDGHARRVYSLTAMGRKALRAAAPRES